MKTEQRVYVQAPKEANATKIWKLQKGVYGLTNASRYWYLCVREQLIKYGANVSSVDPSIFYWKGNSPLVGILECCIDDMIWGGDEMFQRNIIKKLKDIFRSRCEEIDFYLYRHRIGT